MQTIRGTVESVVAGAILTGLSAWGLRAGTPELAEEIERWVGHTFEVALLIGYAALHRWVRRGRSGDRTAPTEATGRTYASLLIRLERGRR